LTLGAALAGVVLATLVGTLLRPTPAPIEVRPREPQPTATVTLYIHVDGAVAAPGVYALAGGARVFEALDAAGGATDEADLRELNLAARVVDGQKLVIAARPPAPPEPGDGPTAAGQAPPTLERAAIAPPATTARINLNTASQRILETLPGVGPVTARRIIDFRDSNGPFNRVEQLREARLVNAPTFERIKGLITAE
jgi:competence protein ComEA